MTTNIITGQEDNEEVNPDTTAGMDNVADLPKTPNLNDSSNSKGSFAEINHHLLPSPVSSSKKNSLYYRSLMASGSLEHGDLPEEIKTTPRSLTATLVSNLKSSGTAQNIDTGKFVIKEGTPAAEALRANADVHVSRLEKVARRLHAPTMRRILKKSILLRTSSGDKRGKPPRIPQGAGVDDEEENDMPLRPLYEEKGLDDDLSSLEDDEKPAKMFVMPKGVGLSKYGTDSEIDLVENKDGKRITVVESPRKQEGNEENQPSETNDKLGSTIVAKFDSTTSENVSFKVKKRSSFLKKSEKEEERNKIFHERKYKRKKKKEEAKQARKSYVKGKVINGVHELYTLSIAVMLGLRTSIGFSNGQLNRKDGKRRWLEIEDFMTVEKYEFSPRGGPKTPPHNLSHTFKFKDYSPLAFAYIRRMFGINEYEFLLSVCGTANFIEFTSNAKSGQFFFYSSDGKYMIKTMTNAESKFLRRILPHYFRHCSQNPNTLITKFLGMYRVKLYHLRRNVKFIIMNSVFDTDKYLQSFFDLKGSVTGRDAPGEDVQKDNDVRRNLPENAFALPSDLRKRVRNQVKRDCEFFKEMKIMDYSMLIGVHHIPSQKQINASLCSSSNSAGVGTSFRDPGNIRVQKETKAIRDILHRRKNINLYYGSQKRDDNNIELQLGKSASNELEQNKNENNTSTSTEFTLREFKGSFKSTDMNALNNDDKHENFADMSAESYSTIDHYFDEDDDYSYLDSSSRNQLVPLNETELFSETNSRPDDWIQHKKMYDLKLKKEDATEQIYWPFHRFYDIQGRRRMNSLPFFDEPRADDVETVVNDDKGSRNGICCYNCLDGKVVYKADIQSSRARWPLVNFEPPVSNRKDGGLEMDATGIAQPIKFGHGKKVQMYDGKIFYIGIIDVLQQFNIRKRVEARWRRLRGSGWEDASCVHPKLYADRFLRFFDEYTQRKSLGEDVEVVLDQDVEGDGHEETIIFSSSPRNAKYIKL